MRWATMQAIGHMPLPPYIDRADTDADRERYQDGYMRSAKAPWRRRPPVCISAPTIYSVAASSAWM